MFQALKCLSHGMYKYLINVLLSKPQVTVYLRYYIIQLSGRSVWCNQVPTHRDSHRLCFKYLTQLDHWTPHIAIKWPLRLKYIYQAFIRQGFKADNYFLSWHIDFCIITSVSLGSIYLSSNNPCSEIKIYQSKYIVMLLQ